MHRLGLISVALSTIVLKAGSVLVRKYAWGLMTMSTFRRAWRKQEVRVLDDAEM